MNNPIGYIVTVIAIVLFIAPPVIFLAVQAYVSLTTIVVASSGKTTKRRSLASKRKFHSYDYDSDI